ncbi:MAG: hypothetical protein AB2693_31800, partial [Candidatus Thiodiazotropha sp.]
SKNVMQLCKSVPLKRNWPGVFLAGKRHAFLPADLVTCTLMLDQKKMPITIKVQIIGTDRSEQIVLTQIRVLQNIGSLTLIMLEHSCEQSDHHSGAV